MLNPHIHHSFGTTSSAGKNTVPLRYTEKQVPLAVVQLYVVIGVADMVLWIGIPRAAFSARRAVFFPQKGFCVS